jgi:hypothetical protein
VTAKKQLRLRIPVRFPKAPLAAVIVPVTMARTAPLNGMPWRPTVAQARQLRFL